MSTEDNSPVHQGQLIAGRYRVEDVLGRGGMGVVFSAMHLQLERRVAIKFLRSQALDHPDVVERFAREARAAAKIRSEHVARVLDVGTLENGAPFMVMEYLAGRDLSSLVRAKGPLPIDDVIDYVLQAAEAIAEAHSLGIVHRDLKPANLFLIEGEGVGSGLVKVLDFGISKSAQANVDGSMTQSAAILGSPFYMSPEQMLSSRDVDPRTDIWSIGVIMYELLTAKLPFEGETLTQLCVAIAQQSAPSVRSIRPEVPAGLGAVVECCLERDRSRRFGSVYDLAVALGAFAQPRSLRSIERIAAIAPRSGATAGPGRFETLGFDAASVALALNEPGAAAGSLGHETPRFARVPGRRSGDGSLTESTSRAWGHTANGSRAHRLRNWTFGAVLGTGALGLAVFALVRMAHGPDGTSAAGAATTSPSTGGSSLRPSEPASLSPLGSTSVTTASPDEAVKAPERAFGEAQPSSGPAEKTRPIGSARAVSPRAAPAGSSNRRRPTPPSVEDSWEDER
jgi:serine/threonine protein kinase